MSLEAREAMDDAWTRWQGYLINGVFPLGRYLGCSDHSGVFLTRSAGQSSSEAAIKLVPATRAVAESLLPRWKRAGAFIHPHLLRQLEWGGCQLEGLPYLYLVMEYADQTLAQLLQHRALTEDETREMLPLILDALGFLHGRNLVQGGLKPANILVVGDQLKLASDTIRYAQDGAVSAHEPNVYEPPEAMHGRSSTAGDIWGFGGCVFEALTRRPPPGPGERAEAVMLPADFSPEFRDLVTRCLSPRAKDRPRLPELVAWTAGRPLGSTPAAASSRAPESKRPAPKAPESKAPEPKASEPKTTPIPIEPVRPEPALPQILPSRGGPETARPGEAATASRRLPAWFAAALGALAIVALGWIAVHISGGHRAPTAPAPRLAPPAPASLPNTSVPGGATVPATAVGTRTPGRIPTAGASGESTAPSALHEVIPDVPWSARRTIRGHIKVWVRVIVEQDGSVFAAVADRTGSSRYFLRLAMQAAKKWTFPAAEAPSRRLMQVRFDFSRDGTTARAIALH